MAIARRAFATRRIGHAGTLDPFATGVLLLLVGPATRLMPYLIGLGKSYAGVLRLGATTTTDDLTGEGVATTDAWREVTDADVTAAMAQLTGCYEQQPPVYSARKVGGQPAHRRARRGEPVVLAPRAVEVRRFTLTSRAGPDVAFEVEVGSGTYVRALARDLGERLACGAHLRALRRTRVGPFEVADAVPLSDVARGGAALRPAAAAVGHLPRYTIDAQAWEGLRHGRAIPAGDAPVPSERPLALFQDEQLVAIAERAGAMLRPKVVLEP